MLVVLIRRTWSSDKILVGTANTIKGGQLWQLVCKKVKKLI
jgi:hypothetical protein